MAVTKDLLEQAKQAQVIGGDKTLYKRESAQDAALSTGQNKQSANLSQASPTASAPTQGAGLQGLSAGTQKGLSQYGQSYTPSAAVEAAQSYLQSVVSSSPGAYQSKYSQQIADLYDQIMNRPEFKYDVNKDPLFQQYKNQYTREGQRAMQDAVGNAAALTGGYGNSWGNTAGYQAYQYYLQQLNDRVPELEQYAFDKYKYEGQELRNNMDMSVNLDNIDYSRYRDTVGDWQADRAFAYTQYSDAANRDQSQWQAMQDYYTNLAGMENSDYWNGMDEAYRQAQIKQQQEQYSQSMAEDQRQYDQTMAEKQRQFDIAQALEQAQFDLQLRKYEDALAEANKQGTYTPAKTKGYISALTQALQPYGSTAKANGFSKVYQTTKK